MSRALLYGMRRLGSRHHWPLVGQLILVWSMNIIASTETSIALSRAAGWPALVSLYALFVLNELLPVVFGSGADASWDWSFVFVTLRFIIIPLASLLYLGANVVVAVRRKRLSLPIMLRWIGAVTLVAMCWTVFGRW